MRVLALTRYARRGASSRLRFAQFYPLLARDGIDVTASSLLDDAFLERRYAGKRPDVAAVATAYLRRAGALLRRERWDLLWLEKEAFPWIPDAIERALTGTTVPIAVDLDDAWFHRYDGHRSAAVRALLGRKLDGVMRRAAVVCAGNDYIADRARRAGAPRVELVPTVVDASRYRPAPAATSSGFTIGWIGTPLTAAYLGALAEPLARLASRGPVTLRAVGAGALSIAGVDVETPAWSEADEAAAIAAFDVGVMPLPDSPWERGKCGYKLIQYMAAGKPVVASPVGVNSTLVKDGENGFLASDAAAWMSALAALRDDPGRRRAMGEAGRALVESTYDLPVVAPRLARILREAAAGGSR